MEKVQVSLILYCRLLKARRAEREAFGGSLEEMAGVPSLQQLERERRCKHALYEAS